jgi:hypothetical protein
MKHGIDRFATFRGDGGDFGHAITYPEVNYLAAAGHVARAARLEERKGRDSNPRWTKPPITVFKACAESRESPVITGLFAPRGPVRDSSRDSPSRRRGWTGYPRSRRGLLHFVQLSSLGGPHRHARIHEKALVPGT